MGKIVTSRNTASVFRALGIFGSLEVMKMLCAVVRTKLVALWIGTAGVGIISLYNSTLDMVKSVALLNMRQSCVPSIAAAAQNPEEQARICHHVDVLGVAVGALTTILFAAFAPLLSLATFGSYSYSWGFALLAPTMFLSSVADARQAVLQGCRRLDVLARATLWAVLAATLLALPLFYFFRIAAIVPVLIIFPVFTAFFLYIVPSHSGQRKLPFDRRLFFATAKSLIRLGSYLTLGVAMGFLADYLLRIYLERVGGIPVVGLFQSGATIIKSYVGLFFTAITMEFFPRLSATISHKRATSLIVAHEIGIALWLLMPVIVIFISFDELVVRLLYSSSFLDIVPYLSIAIIATVLRAVSWCFSYVIVAKGDGRIYLLTEAISAISLLVFSYIGWKNAGFAGLGWAYVGEYLAFTAAVWLVCRLRYGLRIPSGIAALILFATAIGFAALWFKLTFGIWTPLLLIPIILIVWIVVRRQHHLSH